MYRMGLPPAAAPEVLGRQIAVEGFVSWSARQHLPDSCTDEDEQQNDPCNPEPSKHRWTPFAVVLTQAYGIRRPKPVTKVLWRLPGARIDCEHECTLTVLDFQGENALD